MWHKYFKTSFLFDLLSIEICSDDMYPAQSEHTAKAYTHSMRIFLFGVFLIFETTWFTGRYYDGGIVENGYTYKGKVGINHYRTIRR